jgi:hypothetical protein
MKRIQVFPWIIPSSIGGARCGHERGNAWPMIINAGAGRGALYR